ncbi:MAG: NADPH-dependent oxidoreductase [Clostridia bacterium]|nr:NADPH-dependent oxidoreductase [Clostridia bacterium]
MKVVVLYGSERHGTTRRLTELFLAGLGDAEITEYCFPRDLGQACLGCAQCIIHAHHPCPHSAQMDPLLHSLREADVIVVSTAVYSMGMTGALKTFFDHLAYRWLVHRPDPAMFGKVGVAIATAAGSCTGKTLRDIRQQFFYWGLPKTYAWGEAVFGGWDYMKPERRAKLARRAAALAAKVATQAGHTSPSLKLRAVFGGLAFMQRHDLSPTKVERDYWLEQGWTQGKRPWSSD